MHRRLGFALPVLWFALAGCGESRATLGPLDPMEAAAWRYIEAWCSGDGSHEQHEFGDVPDLFLRWSQTVHDLPQNKVISSAQVEDKGPSGAGNVPELLDYAFDLGEGFDHTSKDVVCEIVGFRVRFEDGSEHHPEIAVRPEFGFSTERRTVTPEMRWLALPRRSR